MRKTLLVLVVALGLLGVGQPAQAATLSWDDKAGDAATSPLPHEDTLDLLKSTITSDGKKVTWSANLKKMAEGNPPQSVGYFFVVSFLYNEITYDIRFKEDVVAKEMTVRDSASYPAPINRPCKDCKYKFDRKAAVVSVELPITSIAEFIKAADSEAPPFTVGSAIEGLNVESFRSFGGISLRADEALAPEGTSFKV